MSKNVVFVTNLYNFSIFITQKRGKSFNIGRTIYLIFLRFYRCFFKTVRQSVYYDRVVGTATPRYIGYGRQKIEGRANTIADARRGHAGHATTVVHK